LAAEHILRAFENKILRNVYETKLDEMTGEWRRLYGLSGSLDVRIMKSR